LLHSEKGKGIMLNKIKWKYFPIGLFAILLVGCGSMEQFSPEQVIANALDADEDLSYYGEMEMTIDGLEELENMVIKEWRHNDKSRVEIEAEEGLVVAVSDGNSITLYEENENRALTVEDDNLENLEMNPKEQVEMLLDMIQDTHDIKTVGEENVANRPAFHMVATKKDDTKTLLGDQELWIDKEHWVVLKMKTISGDVQNNMEYTTIDFDEKLDESVFQLDLPDEVAIESLDDLSDGYLEEEIALDDIPEKANEPVLYIPDGTEHEMEAITFIEIEGEPAYQDITIDYKQEELPLMTLTIVIGDDGEEAAEEEMNLLEEGFDKEQIRNEEGIFIELQEYRSISWSEGGLRYAIDIIDPNVTLDMVKQWAEEMEEIK